MLVSGGKVLTIQFLAMFAQLRRQGRQVVRLPRRRYPICMAMVAVAGRVAGAEDVEDYVEGDAGPWTLQH